MQTKEARLGPACWQPGQLLVVGFDGHRLPGDLRDLIAAGRVGGVVLFARNVSDPDQLRSLTGACHDAAPAGVPLIVAVDQEGGRVQRLREPWTVWPPMRQLGDRDDEELTRQVATAMAIELRDVGFNLDFAPVVDVDSNPANPVIGDRSFSRDGRIVMAQTRVFIESMQRVGIAACAKHFPGHGDTSSDSHLELPRLDFDMDRLQRLELPPFRSAVDAGVASIMSAHVLFPRLDPKRPATLSPDIIGLLRHEIGFEGLVFSDDLEMRGVADHFDVEARSLGALRAGIDSLLVCRQADLRDEILRRLERAPDSLLEGAVGRMVAFKRRWSGVCGGDGDGRPPYPQHQTLALSLGDSGA